MDLIRLLCASSTALAAACAAPQSVPLNVPDVPLQGTDGRTHALARELGASRATVITFFSADCPCQRAHDARLRDMALAYRDRGVAFFAVDSESPASIDRDAREAHARELPFPILSDPRGEVADALGADFATFSVIVDATGRVRYKGSIDSDKTHLREDSARYLADALDRVLSGGEPSPAETKALGCSLRRR
jgi:peroxiredoxin